MSTALAESSSPTLGQGSVHRLVRRAWMAVSAAAAAVLGLLPHVLHHVGPLAGAALFAGATGSLLFGALGFVAAIPFLRRAHRRCGNWRVPAAILASMVVVFSLSTLVVGPAITGADQSNPAPASPAAPGNSAQESAHEAHH